MAKKKKSSSTRDLQRLVTEVQRHRSEFSGLGRDLWLWVCDTARHGSGSWSDHWERARDIARTRRACSGHGQRAEVVAVPHTIHGADVRSGITKLLSHFGLSNFIYFMCLFEIC
ncbi:hypothetical protein F2Q70_00036672 [Brassica cretica]|uniref:Uncharacterized protein n=1 Tax=Brassica cretica TaxID=69181 RepID=A0A3N6S237_BRACR|nr:hypothetical protein F2Q70_00036672 [Brassica cretica]